MGLLYTQELASRAQAWLIRPLTTGPEGKRSAEGLLELASIWAAIHRMPLPECIRQCQYSERCASVAAYLREFSRFQNTDAMSDTPQTSKYRLAPQFANETLVDENLNGSYTAETLTDEVAEHFIKLGRKDLFVEVGGKAVAPEAADNADGRDYAKELETEQKAHATTTGKLDKETDAHSKSADALKAEKEAHRTTKKEVSELQKQVADLQKQLAKALEVPAASATPPAAPAAPEADK